MDLVHMESTLNPCRIHAESRWIPGTHLTFIPQVNYHNSICLKRVGLVVIKLTIVSCTIEHHNNALVGKRIMYQTR